MSGALCLPPQALIRLPLMTGQSAPAGHSVTSSGLGSDVDPAWVLFSAAGGNYRMLSSGTAAFERAYPARLWLNSVTVYLFEQTVTALRVYGYANGDYALIGTLSSPPPTNTYVCPVTPGAYEKHRVEIDGYKAGGAWRIASVRESGVYLGRP